MADLATEIHAVRAKVTESLKVAEGDNGASPVLVAVVREFAAKGDNGASPVLVAVVREFAAKADKAVGDPARESVIELEQAGDSAKAAAEADPGAQARTWELVLDAHLAICRLKAASPA